MPVFPSVEDQLKQITRGTAQIETRDELKKKLERSFATGKPLRIKLGIDPTGFDVHLGHTVPLALFQNLATPPCSSSAPRGAVGDLAAATRAASG